MYAAALALLSLAWYAVYSLYRHRLHHEGLDLGIFDQAVRHLAHFQAPISHIKGVDFNLFGDHFHPIIVLAVPLYWLYPHAESLLLTQAAAVALSVWVVARFAQRRLGPRLGLAVGAAYSLAWGLQSALAFDFHEVSLGVPVIAAASVALLERRWRAAYVWIAVLLLVKEDMAFTVAAFGVVLLLHRRPRAGALVIAGAAAWFALVVWVIVPALSPFGRYTYGSRIDLPASPIYPHQSTLHHLPWHLLNGEQAHTLLLVLLPTLFLALRSPLVLVLVPTLGWRFLSGNSSYWGTEFHYSAILMPVVFIAGVDGLVRLLPWLRRWVRPRAAARTAVAGFVVVALALLAQFPFWQATRASFWERCPRCAAADRVLAHIPDGARVAADTLLMPELTDRADVYLIAPDFRDSTGAAYAVDYVLLDERHGNLWPQPGWVEALKAELADRGFREVYAEYDYELYRR